MPLEPHCPLAHWLPRVQGCPAAVLCWQRPPAHVWPDAHAFPQLPQFCESVLVFVSQPSLKAGPLQSAKPAAQVMLHVPLLQEAIPLLELQTWLQNPQLLTVLRLVSQPSDGLLLQSA